MNALPEIERERIERAISVARILGGMLSLAVGPFLPNVGLPFVLLADLGIPRSRIKIEEWV